MAAQHASMSVTSKPFTGDAWRRSGAMAILLSSLLVALAFFCSAQAQSPLPAPKPAQHETVPDEIDRLIAILEHDATRARLIERLRQAGDASAAEATAGATEAPVADRPASRLMLTLAQSVTGIGAALGNAAGFLVDLPRLYAWVANRISDNEERSYLWSAVGTIALAIGVGGLAGAVVARQAVRWRQRTAQWRPAVRWPRAAQVAAGFAAAATPMLAFWLVSLGMVALLQPQPRTTLVAVTIANAHVAAAALTLLSRAMLSPHAPALRLASLDDVEAKRIHAWLRAIFFIAVYGYCVAMIAATIGMFVAAYDTLTSIVGIVMAGMIMALVWRERALIHRAASWAVRRNDIGRRLPAVWHWPILAYVLATLLLWLSDGDEGMAFLARASAISFAAIALALAAVAASRRLLHYLVGWVIALRPDDVEFPNRLRLYARTLQVGANVAVMLAAALVVGDAWGAPAAAWMRTTGGVHLVASLASLAVVGLVAIAIWEAINLLVERMVRAQSIRSDDLRRAARRRTLMPLVRRASLATLCVLFGLVALSEMGVNIGPLLAGAGIVGIAVGFGAQAIVKDIFGGISVLMEDSIAIGDIVQIAGKGGVVDWMTMRSVRLRDFDGAVHTVPFGEIATVSNLTKTFAFAVFRIGVSYSTDIAQVQDVVRKVIGDMRRDAELGAMILDDVELHGIDKFDDSAVVVLARVKVAPAKQWTVSRQFRVRLKAAFDRLGIEIPFPQRTITYAQDAGAVTSRSSDRRRRRKSAKPAHRESDGAEANAPAAARG